jgi:hypothetical protein
MIFFTPYLYILHIYMISKLKKDCSNTMSSGNSMFCLQLTWWWDRCAVNKCGIIDYGSMWKFCLPLEFYLEVTICNLVRYEIQQWVFMVKSFVLSCIRGLHDIKWVLDLMIKFIWPVYNLLQHFTNHYLWLDTLGFWPDYTNPLLLQLNCQLLVASRYIALGQTTQKTHPLPSSGWPLLFCICCRGMCLLSCCLAMGLCVTIWKNSYRYCIQRFICTYWQEWVSTKLWLLKLVSMSWITHSVCDNKKQSKRNVVTGEKVQNIQAQLWISACNVEWSFLLSLNKFHYTV